MTQVDEKYKHLYGCYPQDDKVDPDEIEDFTEEEYNELKDRRIKHVKRLLAQGVN